MIKDVFETAKNELGLDHNETRNWHGWHRYVSLVMLAFALLAVVRDRSDYLTDRYSERREAGLKAQTEVQALAAAAMSGEKTV